MPGGLPEPADVAAVDTQDDEVDGLAGVADVPADAALAADDVASGLAAELAASPPLLAGDGIDPAERTPRSFHLSRRLLERARAAAYWAGQSPEAGEPTNVSELVERALRGEVERLERTYNGGHPFPAVVGKMRTGPGASGVERIRRAQRARRRT